MTANVCLLYSYGLERAATLEYVTYVQNSCRSKKVYVWDRQMFKEHGKMNWCRIFCMSVG